MSFRIFASAGMFSLLLPLSVATTGGAQVPASGTVTVEMYLQSSQWTLHEPVILTFEIVNKSQNPVQTDLGKDRKENFKIAVTPPTGDTMHLPQLRRSGFGRLGDVVVPPGETYSQNLLLNELYSFTDTGLYEIEIELAGPAITNYATVGGQPVFHMRLEIQPRSAEVLASRCEDLASGIESSTSYERSAERALALSYINDPVAVPYLQRALVANKLVEPVAITGLGRIATADAARALSPALKMNINHASALAKAALLRMEGQTADPEVKQEIHRVLDQAAKPTS
jgi:hypothetical protein